LPGDEVIETSHDASRPDVDEQSVSLLCSRIPSGTWSPKGWPQAWPQGRAFHLHHCLIPRRCDPPHGPWPRHGGV
jgi:hypothetical protein